MSTVTGFIRKNKWIAAALVAFLIFALIKVFFLELFIVNNNDMLSTYGKGDVVFIKKTKSDLERGNVICISYPVPDSMVIPASFIQRLVAMPGDTLQIVDKAVFVNNQLQEEPLSLQYNYFLKSKKINLDSSFFLNYGVSEGGKVSDEFDYSFALTKAQKDTLMKDTLIKSIELKKEQKNMFDETCFPGSIHCNWNADQYGKIYLPKKLDSIALDTNIISLYENIIVNYEKNELAISRDSIFINGIYTKYYKVQQNYYFVLGDNRDNANDSRSWGFLPESAIKGKVVGSFKKTTR